ncbi:amino acid ABC transporter permease [Leucobacter sp.]
MPSWDVWSQWLELMWGGLRFTFALSAISSVTTLLFGAVLALLAVAPSRWVRFAARSWIEVFRSIPLLAMMILFYFGMGPLVAKIGMNAFTIAVISLTLSMSSYVAEVFRGAVSGVSRKQWDAASSIGMSHSQTLRWIIIPQVLAPLVPPAVNIVIGVIKFSSLASLITVNELTLSATQAVSISFYPLYVYVLVGLFYAALILPLIYFSRWLERWVQRRFGLVSAPVNRGLASLSYEDVSKSTALAAGARGEK